MMKKRITLIVIIALISVNTLCGCSKKGSGAITSPEPKDTSINTSTPDDSGKTAPETLLEIHAVDESGNIASAGNIYSLKYTIEEYTDYTHASERGYKVDTLNQPNAPYFFFISSGEKATGGYDIRVADIFNDGQGKIHVVVEETAPSMDAMVIQSLTYPTCCVSFSEYPQSIVIENTEGYVFEEVK